MLVLTEPTMPLNNADQGGSFCFIRGNSKVDPEKDQVEINTLRRINYYSISLSINA